MAEGNDYGTLPNQETREAIEDVNQRRELWGSYRTIDELREALDDNHGQNRAGRTC